MSQRIGAQAGSSLTSLGSEWTWSQLAEDMAGPSFCKALSISPKPGLIFTSQPLQILETNDLFFEAQFPHLWGQLCQHCLALVGLLAPG